MNIYFYKLIVFYCYSKFNGIFINSLLISQGDKGIFAAYILAVYINSSRSSSE